VKRKGVLKRGFAGATKPFSFLQEGSANWRNVPAKREKVPQICRHALRNRRRFRKFADTPCETGEGSAILQTRPAKLEKVPPKKHQSIVRQGHVLKTFQLFFASIEDIPI
jgi:hypothetical protein